MKTIILIRHAKSSWDQPLLSDHDRPLNQRGQRDLPLMATLAAQEIRPPDACLTSTALRALVTAEAFSRAWNLSGQQFQASRSLYHASEGTFLGMIQKLPASYTSVAFAGHNPGLTDLINFLQKDEYLDNLPTCGVFLMHFSSSTWAAVTEGSGKIGGFYYPKMLLRD